MGHTNSTANYNLPQFVGTDKPTWLGDINNAFSAIDTAIASAASTATTADGKADALGTTVSGHTTQIGTLSNTVTAQGNTLNTVTALIGNGTPTTTDQTIIGAINELDARTRVSTIETAAANQTYAAQLAQLKAKYDLLSDYEKVHAVIEHAYRVFSLIDTRGIFNYTKVDSANGSVKSITMNIAGTVDDTTVYTDGTVTHLDVSSETNSATLKLVVI